MSQHIATCSHNIGRRGFVLEFARALRSSFTYNPSRNAEFLFGFMWGLPIPLVALAIHLHAANQTWSFESVVSVLVSNLWYIVLLLHPIFFAIIFGAHGTMRLARDTQIRLLLAERESQIETLNATNVRLEELDRLKSELLANVTHELKSPLVTALGYTDRVLNTPSEFLTEKQRSRLDVSKRNMIRLRNLIDEILDFSQLQSGVAKFVKVTTSLKDAVSAAVESALMKAREREVALDVTLPEGPALITGDPSKLIQIVVNILDNAIKFSPPKAAVRVALSRHGAIWRCNISDQGPGIPKVLQARLFQRFGQIDGSLSRPHEGVGLGLMIVKKMVEMHGGRIGIESTVGIGTTVSVELPADLENQKHPVTETEAAYAAHSDC